MIQWVVPLAKLLPTAHFPIYEDLSRLPGRPSGLFAGKVLWTISLPLSTPGLLAAKVLWTISLSQATYCRPKGLKIQ